MSGKQVKSDVISPEEVLAYLNQLGYTNISAQMLKEFLTDLKKLLKYYKKHNLSDFDYKTIDPLYNDQHVLSQQYGRRAKKAETAPPSYCGAIKGNHQISIQVKKPRKVIHKHCVHIEKDAYTCGCNTTTTVSSEKIAKLGSVTKQSGNSPTKESSPIKEAAATTRDSSPTKETSRTNGSSTVVEAPASKTDSEMKPKKKKCSVKSAKSVNRCDPVALYHHYQSEWKKVKLPGEDNHSDLRRLIRSKLRGDSQGSQRSTSRTRSCRC